MSTHDPAQADDARARDVLKSALEATGDPSALGLLAHVDYELGLLQDAREDVRVALQKKPDDAKLTSALRNLSRRLTDLGVPDHKR